MAVKKSIEKTEGGAGEMTAETTLAEALKKNGAEKIMAGYGLPCLTCPFAKMEMEQLKLGDICGQYGIDMENLLKDLNKK
ncbi:MAG: disulfide oxidoreductase [Candidatus Paceibacterota bacterium]|jgi:hypothetical protein